MHKKYLDINKVTIMFGLNFNSIINLLHTKNDSEQKRSISHIIKYIMLHYKKY